MNGLTISLRVVDACNQMPAHTKGSSIKCFAGNFLEKAKARCLESDFFFFFFCLPHSTNNRVMFLVQYPHMRWNNQ